MFGGYHIYIKASLSLGRNVSTKRMFFLTTEQVDDAICIQLQVFVDMRMSLSRQALSCHSVSEVVLVVLNDRSVVAVETDITSIV